MLRNNKLNRIKIFTGMLVLLVTSYSCNDLVDEVPISEIAPDNFFRNNQDLEAALIAVYDGVQNAYSYNTFYWGELRSDNHQPTLVPSNQDNLQIVNNDITQGNKISKWNRFYQVINRANQVILNAPTISGYNKNFLGEAHAIRAKAYFDAIRVWGDVPLFTEPVKLLSDAYRTTTNATTIMNDVVLVDMLKAETLVTAPSNNYRFSKASIYALQAEVYMWLKDYPKAKIAIESLINLGEHRLVTTPQAWDDLFYNNVPIAITFPNGKGKIQKGSELILSINYDLLEQSRFDVSTFTNRSGIMDLYFAGIPSYVMSSQIETKWREKFPVDSLGWVTKYPNTNPVLRKTVTVSDGMGGVKLEERKVYGDWRYYFSRQGRVDGFDNVEIGKAKTAKWNQVEYRREFDDTDIVLYRYADMILLLAEAENQIKTDGIRALELVNQVRTARQLPIVSATEFGSTQGERLNFILDERQLELFGEGKRWWDLLRNNKAQEVMNPILSARNGGVPLTPGRELWPIFVDHLIENPSLEQNDAYKN